MTDTIEEVESKRIGNGGLGSVLHGNRQFLDGLQNRSSINVEVKEASSGIGASDSVETGGKENTGDSVETGQDPSELRLVDGQVWGNRSLFSLVNENLVLFIETGVHSRKLGDKQFRNTGHPCGACKRSKSTNGKHYWGCNLISIQINSVKLFWLRARLGESNQRRGI